MVLIQILRDCWKSSESWGQFPLGDKNGTSAKYFIDIPSGPKLTNYKSFCLFTIDKLIYENYIMFSHAYKDGMPLR